MWAEDIYLATTTTWGKKADDDLEVKKPLKFPSIPSLKTSILLSVMLSITSFLCLCPFLSIHYFQESKIVLELQHVTSSWDSFMHRKAELWKIIV